MYVIYAIFVIIGSSILIRDTGSASARLFIRGARPVEPKADQQPTEGGAETAEARDEAPVTDEKARSSGKNVFTFKDVTYSVNINGADKALLNGISGLGE